MKIIKTKITALLFAIGFTSIAIAQGVTDNEIILGQSVALSGPAQELGKDMQMGAKVYFDYVNANGGVNGRKITLKTLDDGYEPPRSAENTKKLINEHKVFALFGYVGTPTSQASLPIFTESKVPFVGPFTGAELLRSPFNKYVFNVRASYYDETELIVNHLASRKQNKIAVLYQNDAYGQAGLAGVEKALSKRGLQVEAKATVERNKEEVGDAVKTLNKEGIQAIVMIGAYKTCAVFIKEMKNAGSKAAFWNVSFVGSKALAAELGPVGRGVQISQVVPFPWDNSIPVVKEYRLLLDKVNGDPGFGTLEGFLAAKVMVEGLKRAGSNLDRDGFIKAMETIKDHDFCGFKINYSSDNHNGSKFVDLTVISKGGKFVR